MSGDYEFQDVIGEHAYYTNGDFWCCPSLSLHGYYSETTLLKAMKRALTKRRR